jgi:circadian clock protein KaiB
MKEHDFKIFVTGRTPIAQRAVDNLYGFCESYLKGSYELNIIDVLEEPEEAEKEKILATPTVIKKRPLPVMRIIGDMSNYDKILQGLNIATAQKGESKGEQRGEQ